MKSFLRPCNGFLNAGKIRNPPGSPKKASPGRSNQSAVLRGRNLLGAGRIGRPEGIQGGYSPRYLRTDSCAP